MRKYLLNGSILSAIVSSVSTIRTGLAEKTDWRFFFSIAASLLTLAVAFGTVHYESQKQALED